MPDKKIGDNSFIFKASLDLFQSLQKNKVLVVSLFSENKQKILNDAFKEIGTCRQTITTRSIATKDGFDVDFIFNDSLFFEVNLFKED